MNEEQLIKATEHSPITKDQISKGLKEVGVLQGMNVMVHSSLHSFGSWVLGGPMAVTHALKEVLTEQGTLIMPTHSGDLSDPEFWSNPAVPESWWEIIRNQMLPYESDATPTYHMGTVSESFRGQKGVLRSRHPQLSFAAWGQYASFVAEDHSYNYGLGEQSPLGRLYDLDGYVLLIGVDHSKNTSMHLAEYRVNHPKKIIKEKSPIWVNNQRIWLEMDDLDYNDSDFWHLGQAFERDCSQTITSTQIGRSTLKLMPQRRLVDYAVQWMEIHRQQWALTDPTAVSNTL
jgi:aminoglycoside 3-N-acetyltransferase